MKLHLRICMVLAAIVAVWGCAKQGYPEGGPRDVAAPVVQHATPESGSTNFTGQKFFVEFDEYVTVKDADKNVLVSPPLSHKAEYLVKKHGVEVRLHDTLKESTTYLFQFINAIADYNEGNLLGRYEYVFSTGGSIDSMSLKGKVLDALTGKPLEETVTVAAYAAWSDSAVVNAMPDYVTRCNANGIYEFNHMRAGEYRLVALQDGDGDLHYKENETVGWADDYEQAQPMARVSVKDSADSTKAEDIAAALPTIYLSVAESRVQRVVNSVFKSPGYIEIYTLMPLSRHCRVHSLDGDMRLEARYNATRDTVRLWVADNAECDSAVLVVEDSTGINDTLRLQYRVKKGTASLIKAAKKPLMRSLVQAKHPYYDTLRLAFETPSTTMPGMAEGDSVVTVMSMADSTLSKCAWHWDRGLDNQHDGMRISLNFDGAPGAKYRFVFPAGVFRDIWDSVGVHRNDSLTFTTEYTRAEDYGSIAVKIADGDWNMRTDGYPLIVQLLDDKDGVVQEAVLGGDIIGDAEGDEQGNTVRFDHLKPAKYRLRAIADADHNREWTPGDYWQQRQPERVVYFDKTLELRANWEMNERWDTEQQSRPDGSNGPLSEPSRPEGSNGSKPKLDEGGKAVETNTENEQ